MIQQFVVFVSKFEKAAVAQNLLLGRSSINTMTVPPQLFFSKKAIELINQVLAFSTPN
jgi:hypothetical protein